MLCAGCTRSSSKSERPIPRSLGPSAWTQHAARPIRRRRSDRRRRTVVAVTAFLSFGTLCSTQVARAVEFAWVPVSSSGPFTLQDGAILLPDGGTQVRLDIFLSDWNPLHVGEPTLGAFQATVDSQTYASGPGAPLRPLTDPDRSAGAFQAKQICVSVPDLKPTGRRCDAPLTCLAGEVCIDNPDWVFLGFDSVALVSTSGNDYTWIGFSDLPCPPDNGIAKYVGSLVLEVPIGAHGTYTIDFLRDPETTFVEDCPLQRFPNLDLTPARIIVRSGACCVGDQCVETSELHCRSLPTGFWLEAFDTCPSLSPCVRGACCQGPGQCRDDRQADTRVECTALGGSFFGGARCVDQPCPLCDFATDARCKSANLSRFVLSDRAVGERAADELRTEGGLLTDLCWQGVYAVDDGSGPGSVDCSPGFVDDFTLAIYEDAGGFPDEASEPLFAQSVTVARNPLAVVQSLSVFEYRVTFPQPLVLEPQRCYWLEIQNDRGEADGCYWRWSVSAESHNLLAAQDTDGTWDAADAALAAELAFCANVEVDPEDCGLRTGACCTPPTECGDTTLANCTEFDGVWHVDQSCPVFACPRPAGACCDLVDGACSDGVADVDCLRPRRWLERRSCADVSCVTAAEIALVPRSSTGEAFLIDEVRNEIILPSGGARVELEVLLSGWDPDRDGFPQLGAFQATLDPAGYASGDGGPLFPLSEPDPSAGAFQVTRLCVSSQTLEPTGATCDPPLACPTGELCIARPDWVFGNAETVNVVVTAIPAYVWIGAIQTGACAIDDGRPRYAGTLVVVVPEDAKGTYVLGWNSDAETTLLNDCDAIRLPNVRLTPARITVETGKCCFNLDQDPTAWGLLPSNAVDRAWPTNVRPAAALLQGADRPGSPGCEAGLTRAQCAALGANTLFDPNARVCTGEPDECQNACLTIVDSDPPDGAIDARQPSRVDGTGRAGWDTLELTVAGEISAVSAADLVLRQEGSTDPLPRVLAVTLVPDRFVRVTLDQPLRVGAWTTLTYPCSGSSVRFGVLPGDVDQDGKVHPLDVLRLIDALTGAAPLPVWAADIDRDGQLRPRDLLREIDLLNGAGAFEPFLGRQLP